MDIEGLIYNAYYIHNPIWVEVTELNNVLELKINVQGRDYNFTMTPRNGLVRFDLSKIILGVVSPIQNKTTLSNIGAAWSIDGVYTSTITFKDGAEINTLSKTFVIGGVAGYESNVPVGNTLSLNRDKWQGLPAFDFNLFEGQILGLLIGSDRYNRSIRVDCDTAYIIFRNRLGGMSSYLFEDYNINEKSKDLGYYITDNNIIDSGTELDKSIDLRTKLRREDVILANHLIDSDEVYLYKKLDNELIRLSGANAISINPKLTIQDFEITFNFAINYSKQW